jgi:preprotein translocase subunit SecB
MADTQAQPTPSLSIEKIYVKDLSLENPGAPQSFTTSEAPQVEVGLRTRGEQIEENVYECVLTITVTAKTADKTLFLVKRASGRLLHRRVPSKFNPDGNSLPMVLFPTSRDDRRCGFARGLSARPPDRHSRLYQRDASAVRRRHGAGDNYGR